MKRLAILLVVAAFAAGTGLAGDKGSKTGTTKGKKEHCEEAKGGCCAGKDAKDAKAAKTTSGEKKAEEKTPESK